MIREVETLDSTSMFPAPLGHPVPNSAESVELEINRLTWSVLDGSATQGDRNRLAELVRSQHAQRPLRRF
jgi:hypothetical protein